MNPLLPGEHQDIDKDFSNEYGEPFKHTNGKWYFLESEKNEDGGLDYHLAVEIDDEGYIAYLERTLANENRLKEVIKEADRLLGRLAA